MCVFYGFVTLSNFLNFFLWREEEGSFSKRKLEGCFFLVVGYIVGVVMVY